MDILVLGSFFYFGAILALYFRFYVLVPAFGLAIVLILISPSHLEPNLLGWGFQTVGVITSFQLGCVTGLGLQAFSPFLQRFRETSASAPLNLRSAARETKPFRDPSVQSPPQRSKKLPLQDQITPRKSA